MNKYDFYSILTAYTHALYIIIICVGSFAIWFEPEYFFIHICLVVLTPLCELPLRGRCPMTMLENYYRNKSQKLTPYDQSFLTHYISQRISFMKITLLHYRIMFVLLIINVLVFYLVS